MKRRPSLVPLCFALPLLVVASCGHQPGPGTTPAAEANEEYCWWTALRTTLAPDEAADRFHLAFRIVGLRNDKMISRGDTAWATAGPTAIDSMPTGGRWAARFVAYRNGDSTRFRYFVAFSPSANAVSAADTLVMRSSMALCAAIAKAAQLPTARPDLHRNPDRDDSLRIWWSQFPVVQPSEIGSAEQRAAARGVLGIRYSIEPTSDGGPTSGLLAPIKGTVEFASGRGRLDVVETGSASVERVKGIELSPTLAKRGDYYLFDSTGFVLVRPRDRTFSLFSYVVASYNYYDSRDGWPLYFGFGPLQADTDDPADSSNRVQQRPIATYWHMETYQDRGPGNTFQHILAAGRMTVVETPAAELGIFRWFGPTQALASVPGGIDALRYDSLGFTSVAVLGSSPDGPASLNLITLHMIVALKIADIDVSRLTLPSDYTESGELPLSSPAPATLVARWRSTPVASP